MQEYADVADGQCTPLYVTHRYNIAISNMLQILQVVHEQEPCSSFPMASIMFVSEGNLNSNYKCGLCCTSKVLAVCTAIRHLYRACACATLRVNSPCKVNTLHLPRPGMHYSGADTGGQQTPLTTGLHPNS